MVMIRSRREFEQKNTKATKGYVFPPEAVKKIFFASFLIFCSNSSSWFRLCRVRFAFVGAS
jgi:hypothetical protein